MSANAEWAAQAAKIFSAITIESPERFKFAGVDFDVSANHQHHHQHHHNHGHGQGQGGHGHSAQNPNGPHPLVNHLSKQLYEFAYSRPFLGQISEKKPADASPDPNFIEAISAANSTREQWSHGWTISQSMHHGQILAARGSETRQVWPGQFISKDGPAAPPRVGAEISIFYAKESRSLQYGFYYAFGEAVEEPASSFGLVRLYWNTTAEGAAPLTGSVTSRLNRFQVPFRFKCATSPGQYGRTDAAVIYIGRRFFQITSELLLDIHPAIAPFLEEDVPLFTKKIARGLGVAEDPGTGESFGQSRCQCLAQTIWNCYLAGDQSDRRRMSEFQQLLAQRGINPEHVHINAGSMDWYRLPRELE